MVTIIEVSKASGLSVETVRRDLKRGAPHGWEGRRIVLNYFTYLAWRKQHGLDGQRGRPYGGGGDWRDSPAERREAQAVLEGATGKSMADHARECIETLGAD